MAQEGVQEEADREKIKMKKIIAVLQELLPVLILLVLFIFIRNEFVIAVLIVIAILTTFKIKYYKKEIYVLLFGVILGILLELFGSFVLKFQNWNNVLFIMPIWLPLSWGYGFVLMRRIGNIIIGKK